MKIHPFYQKNYIFCPRCGARLEPAKSHLHCPQCGFDVYFKSAPTVSIFVEQNGQVLLAKRKIDPFQGWWDAVGGFVEVGETVEQACHREMKEETGVEIEIGQYLSNYPDEYQGSPVLNFGFSADFVAENDGGSPQLSAADDVAKLHWFDLDQLPKKIAFESVKQLLADYVKLLKT